jgi:hypothetical protein
MRFLLPAGRSIRAQRAFGFAVSLSLHAVVVALLILRAPADGHGTSDIQSGGQLAIVAVPEDILLPIDPPADDQDDPPVDTDSALSMDEFSFDVERIRRRQHALFPFLTSDVLFLEPLVERTRADPSTLFNPLGSHPPSDQEPLILDGFGIQRVVDQAWSRRDRWTKFAPIAKLLDGHDPHTGQAADLVHAYLDQNLLQPYEDAGTRDSKYWVMMELVSDHAEFIDFIRSFSRRHPASRTTTELLFLLDELAQGSLDSLLMLLQTDAWTDLTATLQADRGAFALAARIGGHYRGWLAAHGLADTADVARHYDRLRLRILDAIVESTPSGYRSGDAQFLIGQILFNQNDVEGAFRAWRSITPGDGDNYAGAYSQILQALDAPGRAAVPQVIGILSAERLRWLEFSRERLRAFGYRFNTF